LFGYLVFFYLYPALLIIMPKELYLERTPDAVAEPTRKGAGESLKGPGFWADVRRKGLEIAGKGVLVAAVGLMAFGCVGCSRDNGPADGSRPAAKAKQDEGARRQIDFRLQEAKKQAAEWGRQSDPGRRDLGEYTRDDKGELVTKAERWVQLIKSSGEGKVRSSQEVEGMLAEIDALEKHLGADRIKHLSRELEMESLR
jgi:hypothetical protein